MLTFDLFMIRNCSPADFDQILGIFNDGAAAYKGEIPADRWKEPYMSAANCKDRCRVVCGSGASKNREYWWG